MARSIATIKSEITTAYMTNETIAGIYGFTVGADFDSTFSKVSLESILFFIVATAIWSLESLFDAHNTEMQNLIDTKKPHRVKWYRDKTLLFQFGQALITDTDTYDNTNLSDDDVSGKKVVKYAAVQESGSKVLIKVAGEENSNRVPLPELQESALRAYLEEIKDAGVVIELVNEPADHYRASFDIYYDPMILDDAGNRLDGRVSQPVHNAIKSYLTNLAFNGEYTNMALIDILQVIEGVVIPELKRAESKYGLSDYSPISAKVTPFSGYLKVYDDADLTLNFIPYATN